MRSAGSGRSCSPPGHYAYCGSAFGPGGLRGRLAHHLRRAERPRWHVDYLRQAARVSDIWYAASPDNLEHDWSRTLSGLAGASLPAAGFGASDCDCPSHLVHLPAQPEIGLLPGAVRAGRAAVGSL